MSRYAHILAILFVITGYFAMSSCYYDVEEELYPGLFCDTSAVSSFSQKVLPILNQHCNTCHSGPAPSGSLSLDTYLSVKARVDDGKLSCSINHSSGCSPMPDNGPKLDKCDIQEVERWILTGANND